VSLEKYLNRPIDYGVTDNSLFQGPNPRDVSNAFFENNQTVYFPHTTFLTGFVEFIIHDLMFSGDGEMYYIPIPKCDSFFDPNCTGTVKFESLLLCVSISGVSRFYLDYRFAVATPTQTLGKQILERI